MRNSPLRRRTPLRGVQVNRPVPRATVQLVVARAQAHCERCGTFLRGERGVDWSIHHRKKRSQRGPNAPSNLLALCGDGSSLCHGWVTEHPELAAMEGTHVKPWKNPLLVPVTTLRRPPRLLRDDGTEAEVLLP